MFFYVVDTHTKCIINDFAPAPRTNIFIFQCHTVTHGTNLRKSPPLSRGPFCSVYIAVCTVEGGPSVRSETGPSGCLSAGGIFSRSSEST